jgi:hypothetical protein
MTNEFPDNLDEVEIGDELYVIRPKVTDGVKLALRRMVDPDGNMACLNLFTTRLKAIEYLEKEGISDRDWWEVVSSKEFGGILSLLKEARSFFTHVAFDPPIGKFPFRTITIEGAIRFFESR